MSGEGATPVPEATPLADMAKPDEAFGIDALPPGGPVSGATDIVRSIGAAQAGFARYDYAGGERHGSYAAAAAHRHIRTAPLLDRLHVILHEPVVPSPGPCPTCGTQRRERGEVRVHVWRCGCAVRPEWVHRFGAGHNGRREPTWCARGCDVEAYHPTEAGASAAWRATLARAQQREDDAALRPVVATTVRNWNSVDQTREPAPAPCEARAPKLTDPASCPACSRSSDSALAVGRGCTCGCMWVRYMPRTLAAFRNATVDDLVRLATSLVQRYPESAARVGLVDVTFRAETWSSDVTGVRAYDAGGQSVCAWGHEAFRDLVGRIARGVP